MNAASQAEAMQNRKALEAAQLWEAFKLQARAGHWGNAHMLCAVATGKALAFNPMADLFDMANED